MMGRRVVGYAMEEFSSGDYKFDAQVNYEVLNVTRPLLSVGKLRETGHKVVLGDDNGDSYIQKGSQIIKVHAKYYSYD